MSVRLARPTLAVVLALCAVVPARADEAPAWLPRYDLDIDLDLAAHRAVCHLRATWTNMQPQQTASSSTPTRATSCPTPRSA